ncbi:alkaline phosphatase family protein [Nocardioides antri]|uniref:Sulfatase-like hydrolase/transferase n=1 Tax=Nocardioides antri TaxID=2607659 RepID=A0A5B1LV26_9ACTN|nr:alkaline phosphatase family protein [Nocardioides antri]KAA1424254.1 sulfatase-like hydrolase/transferase [Nocardioides antri]
MTTTARRRLAVAASLALVATLSSPSAASAPEQSPPAARFAAFDRQVLAISVDGLDVRALRRTGPDGAPNLHRLLRQGASTRNARSQVEMTVTLPNHTSMLTGRRIDAAEGGHGVTWNRDRSRTTVQEAAGGDVASIFTRVNSGGGRTALFATESKFSLFQRSWPLSVNRSTIVQDGDRAVTDAARRDLLRHDRAFTFLHLGAPDEAGHAHGWLSPAYLRAVRKADRLIGTLLRTIKSHPRRLGDVVIVLTSDHGGGAGTTDHRDETCLCNYRVPFLIWGPGVTRGDLYALNPTYADPGRDRILFDGAQPIRNGDLANLSASLLGLGPVPGSLWGADQSLTWTR